VRRETHEHINDKRIVSAFTRLIDAAKARTVEFGVPIASAIVDESGTQNASLRMDSGPLYSIEVAINKARTTTDSASRPMHGTTSSE
jgi:uncharacterized protein GlcG (DUF336 family)